MSTKKNKPINYVDNTTLLNIMIEYKNKVNYAKEHNLNKPPIPELVGSAILQIANGLASKSNFSGYSWKEEMISDGIENVIKYIDNFEPIKEYNTETGKPIYNNPFAYFTQIIWFSFIRRIKNEKIQQYIKHKNLYNLLTEYSLDEQNNVTTTGTGKILKDIEWNDSSFDIIDQFEKSIIKKKKITKKKGVEKYLDVTDKELERNDD